MLTKFLVTTVTPTHTTYQIFQDDKKIAEDVVTNEEYAERVANMKYLSTPALRFEEDRLLVQGADGTSISLGDSVPKKDPNA